MSSMPFGPVLDVFGRIVDQIRLTGVEARGHHGVFGHEKRDGQTFSADVVVHIDVRSAARGDALDKTAHYGELAEEIAGVLGGPSFDLVETVAETIAATILDRVPNALAVDVAVHKPHAPITVPFGDVSVSIRRDRNFPAVLPPAAHLDVSAGTSDDAPFAQPVPGLAPMDEPDPDPDPDPDPEPVTAAVTGPFVPTWAPISAPEPEPGAPTVPDAPESVDEDADPADEPDRAAEPVAAGEPFTPSDTVIPGFAPSASTAASVDPLAPTLGVAAAAAGGVAAGFAGAAGAQAPVAPVGFGAPTQVLPPVTDQPSAFAPPSSAQAAAPEAAPAPAAPHAEHQSFAHAVSPVAAASSAHSAASPDPAPAAGAPAAPDRLDQVPAGPVDVVLALGANLGTPQVTLARAVAELRSVGEFEVVQVGPLARTRAIGEVDQPDFLNTIVLARTTLAPRELLRAVQRIEANHGRVRDERWGPRTLDIDVIVYGSLLAVTDDLELPHPRAHERAFVLQPWAQIAPEAVLPGLGGGPVGALAATAPDRDGIRWIALDWLDATASSAGPAPGAAPTP